MLRFLTLSLFFCTHTLAAQHIHTARPLPLTEQQQNTLLETEVSNPVIQNQTLWFTTPGRLWSWSFEKKVLRYHRLQQHARKITALAPYENGFVATTHQQLLFIQLQPFGVFSIQQPSTTLALQQLHNSLWWIRTDGASLIDTEHRSLEHQHKFKGLQSDDQVFLTESPNTLWVSRKNDLFYMEKKLDQVRYRHITKTTTPILQLSADKNSMYITTAHNAERFSLTGEKIQTLPMRGSQSIIQTHITDTQHSYLLSSRILEVYDLKNQKIERHRLPIKNAKSIKHLHVQGSYVSFLLDGMPTAFQLEQPLTSTAAHQKSDTKKPLEQNSSGFLKTDLKANS